MPHFQAVLPSQVGQLGSEALETAVDIVADVVASADAAFTEDLLTDD